MVGALEYVVICVVMFGVNSWTRIIIIDMIYCFFNNLCNLLNDTCFLTLCLYIELCDH